MGLINSPRSKTSSQFANKRKILTYLGVPLKTPPRESTARNSKNNTITTRQKNLCLRNETTPKRRKSSPKKNKPREVLEEVNKRPTCLLDHKSAIDFKEESDRRYFKEGSNLYETKCVGCQVLFTDAPSDGNMCYVPSNTQPTYFCNGRTKYNCKYGYCSICYLKSIGSSGRSRRSR